MLVFTIFEKTGRKPGKKISTAEDAPLCYNFTDDNTVSFCGKMLDNLLNNLKFNLVHILKWFKGNSLKPNPGKFQFRQQILTLRSTYF